MPQGRVERVNPSGVLGGHRKQQKCLWRTDLGEVGKRAPGAERSSDTRIHRKLSSQDRKAHRMPMVLAALLGTVLSHGDMAVTAVSF